MNSFALKSAIGCALLLSENQVSAQQIPASFEEVLDRHVVRKESSHHHSRDLKSMLRSMESFDDASIDKLLISDRQNVHHLLYDEVMDLIKDAARSFPDIVKLESIGKSYEGRDIIMIKIDATKKLKHVLKLKESAEAQHTPKSILLTGAHHSRELVSVQMPLYSMLELLHGYANHDKETLEILARSKVFVIPILNVDGSHSILEHYKKTGELLLKRKNNNRAYETAGDVCPPAMQGVDINRNYGYLWGNTDGPCSDSFPGPYAFSEPESKAMRDMLYKYQEDIKFVYNFHAFGPMYVWPYNGQLENQLAIDNPQAQRIFNEIWDEATFPSTTLKGNAIDTVGYQATGECNDYIMKQFNIPSVSPELANDDFFSNDFFLKYDYVVRNVLKDNYPWIKHTFKKHAGEIDINYGGKAQYTRKDGILTIELDVKNIGLQGWNLRQEHFKIHVFDKHGKDVGFVPLPDLAER